MAADPPCTLSESCDCRDCQWERDHEDRDCDGTRTCECEDCMGDCHWCGGDGWDECHDSLECTSEHNELGECRCSSCGGSGLRRDMTIW